MNVRRIGLFGLLSFAAFPAQCHPEAAPPMRLLHWPQFPVRVYLPAHGPGQADEEQTALAGFDEWVTASHGFIRYVRVSDKAQAQITVEYVPGRFLSPGAKSAGAVGETTLSSSVGVLKKASVRLAEGAAAPEDLQATAAHEFGHALGISGHSDDPDDLMYPIEMIHSEAQDPSLPSEAHTVTAHDLQLLAGCYPGLFSRRRQ
jgi:predicted Zn-dependent protease